MSICQEILGTFVFGLHELFLNPEKKNGEAVVYSLLCEKGYEKSKSKRK